MTTLRGFQIGMSCAKLLPAYGARRKEGFKLPSPTTSCNLNAGRYRVDYLLHEEEDRQELIELYFTPTSELWRAKVTMTWEGTATFSVRPSPEQVIASLKARFGAPFVMTTDGALLDRGSEGMHSVSLAWSSTPPADGPGPEPSDSSTWGRWSKSLSGVVTRASVHWTDASRKVNLVVEMADHVELPKAIKAQEDARAEAAAAWARQDSRVLKGL
ncbi:hypothetical protein [Paucibacter soli]|uniref:hypothetical protein n=1 Tax=Paucibacter soli TaxID=3133433 RepID=UPI0030B4771F